MNVKTQFSIKDLENLSGVKAHTIRIWEKRYNLLAPKRTETNIRTYDLHNLKRLLNISYLYNDGLKISKIANLSEEEIKSVIEIQSQKKKEDYSLKVFKTAMLEFDTQLFSKTYNELSKDRSFRKIFADIFIPLLKDIGLLWQTGTIDPIHESFISECIKQKIILNLELEQQKLSSYVDTTFALFLPQKELHDIGLMYANYELTKAGFKSIYLGSNIPVNNLQNLLKHKEKIIFLTYLTVQPEQQSAQEFITNFIDTVCSIQHCDLWVMGPKTKKFQTKGQHANIRMINNLDEFIHNIKLLKES